MKPVSFAYEAPRSLDDALAALARYGEDAKVLAGGQSLVPLLNFRLARPTRLIDINRVPGLDGIAERDGALGLGGLVRQREVEASPVVASRAPLLAEATAWIGHPPIRARGTVGGSVAHNDPAAEYPAALLALDARVRLARSGSERVLPIGEFLGDWLGTSAAPDELVTSVEVPTAPWDGHAVLEVAKRHGDFALSGVAVLVRRDGPRIGDARIVAFGGLPRATRLAAAEDAVRGAAPGDDAYAAARSAASAAVEPVGDIHATADYRRHLTGVLVARALRQALAEA